MFWPRVRIALPLILLVLLVDCSTKDLAVTALSPEYTPHPVAGDVVRLTLAYNQDAAMGLPLGRYGRWPLVAMGLGIIAVLVRMLWITPPADLRRRISLGLVIGGALGNVTSRIMTPRGVVDFIDLGIGEARFYLFNVADIAVCAGAVMLAFVLWRDGRTITEGAPS
jgi:signal peptidase II